MSPSKEHNKIVATQSLIKAGIKWEEFNNGYHYKIRHINFYPTTGLWQSDNIGGDKGRGIDSLIRLLKKDNPIVHYRNDIKKLSVSDMSRIFIKNSYKSLVERLELLHKEIYK